MRKILVVSDSHGTYEYLKKAVELYKTDQVIHLGDGFEDAQRLSSEYFQIPVVKLCGNCDFGKSAPNDYVDELEGVRLLACHGHKYHVKSGMLSLYYAAREKGAALCLYGHTHIPAAEDYEGILLMNPGPAGGANPGCIVLLLDAGNISWEYHSLL